MKISKNSRILFTGDSITDSERDRNDFNSLAGYSKIVNDYIQLFNPELNVTVMNRGISGDTTKMLSDRMETDILETKPDIISILIGINDVWRRYDSDTPTSPLQFEKNFKNIIKTAKKYVSKIIILEPFLLTTDKNKDTYREDLDPKVFITRKLAKAENLEFIPFDGIFAELSIMENPAKYSADGVHPTFEGNRVIASEFLKRTDLFK